MSITIDKLRALKRQAGTEAGSRRAQGAAMPAAPNAASVEVTLPSPSPRPQEKEQPLQAPSPATAGEGWGGVPLPWEAAATCKAPTPDRPAGGHSSPALFTLRADGSQAGLIAPLLPQGEGPKAVNSRDSLATLRRLLGVRERKPVLPPASRAPVDRSLPGTEIAPGLHCIETRLPFAAPADALALAFARRDAHVDPRALLFFDTETTGLAGGTGTRAFMIGAADWLDDTLRIRQLLISTMAAETAMLREFAGWLSPDTVLASYNGRSYDAPLLKTRYRLARLPDPLHGLDHLDLLHPTRRRYRGRWENCRLATIERELLKIVREDDLPGSQAPMAWLGFLRGGASTLLRRVAAHNHQDVVTLAQLLLRLVEAQAAD
jgi:uncharacterized protein YprB with RNaseH-like and TPR domain